MLRAAPPVVLDQLLCAAVGSDRDLDLALLRLGVLAPADLGLIKEMLSLDGVSLQADVNPDGHCVIAVLRAGAPLGLLHHNGDIEVVDAALAA